MFALMPFSRASLATETPGSHAAAASRSRSSLGQFGRPARLPGFFSENSDKVVSIKSKVMDIILLRTEVTPYNGRDEPLI